MTLAEVIPNWVPAVAAYMGQGLLVTVYIACASAVASLLLGAILGVLLTFPSALVRAPIRAYVEVWRGLPNIITLFFIFFVLPAIGINVNESLAAVIGLSLWGSANVAEIVRGSVVSISQGQYQCAFALGLNWRQAMAYVIGPQALRRTIPPTMGLLTNLIQSTALASVIGVLELVTASERSIQRLTISSGDSHAVVILGAVALIFFVVCTPLTRYARRLEQRLK